MMDCFFILFIVHQLPAGADQSEARLLPVLPAVSLGVAGLQLEVALSVKAVAIPDLPVLHLQSGRPASHRGPPLGPQVRLET